MNIIFKLYINALFFILESGQIYDRFKDTKTSKTLSVLLLYK